MTSQGQHRTFISCILESWQAPWIVHQPMMAEVVRQGHRVLFVLPHTSMDDLFNKERRKSLGPHGLTRFSENIAELKSSPWFPRAYFNNKVNHWFVKARAFEIKRHLKHLGWNNSVLMIWHPLHADYLDVFPGSKVIYHIGDFFPGFYEGFERDDIVKKHYRLIEKADLVLPCSEALLADARTRRTSGVHLLENGVAFDRYQIEPGPIPEDMKNIPKPVVAYIGRLNKRTDLSVLIRLAEENPTISVLLLGPTAGWMDTEMLGRFRRLKNAYILPGKSQEELPHYTRAIDVGLIAYRMDTHEYAKYCYPLKMLEYFSVGKPVVTVDLVSIRKYQPLLTPVQNDQGWSEAVRNAIKDDSPERSQQRKNIAKGLTWNNRAQVLLSHIEELS